MSFGFWQAQFCQRCVHPELEPLLDTPHDCATADVMAPLSFNHSGPTANPTGSPPQRAPDVARKGEMCCLGHSTTRRGGEPGRVFARGAIESAAERKYNPTSW
jgi:hypothetical protein